MEIIIDGYNLIGYDQGLRGVLEHKRNGLIQRLSTYRQLKPFEVTIVFDGWQSGSRDEMTESKGGVKVIFSRLGEKADSVIVRNARAVGSGCVVVTSDVEIRRAIEKIGAVAVSAGEFADILQGMDRPYESSQWDDSEPQSRKNRNPKRLSRVDKRRSAILGKLRV